MSSGIQTNEVCGVTVSCKTRIDKFEEKYLKEGRPLEDWEVLSLESLGNRCSDWTKIKVSSDFCSKGYVRNLFLAENFLGSQTGRDSNEVHVGVENSTFEKCHLESEVSIRNVNWMSCAYVSTKTKLWNIGRIQHDDSNWTPNFSIFVGSEVKGRELSVFPEMTPLDAEALLRPNGKALQERESFSLSFSIFEESCFVENVSHISKVFFSEGTIAKGALELEEIVTLCNAEESVYLGAGVSARRVMLQWSCKLDRNAVAERVFFFEQSSLDQGGVIVSSCIGSNTHVAKGEVTASFVGPFVGMHHQSLLIGAIWPEGKGNVGYGANVGSNHTGRAPDQEFWPAEGQFFGLSSSVKFPANHKRAPYTIIATGLILPPQIFSFPFSLVNQAKVTVGNNDLQHELIPAWMLLENRYGLVRTAWKVKVRNKSKRYEFETHYLNDRSVESVLLALEELESLEKKDKYFSGEFKGCKGCFMTRNNVERGMKAYRDALEFYFLSSKFLGEQMFHVDNALLKTIEEKFQIEHSSTEEMKRRFIELKENEFKEALRSKDKDRARGTEFIPDYDFYHPVAKLDPCLIELERQLGSYQGS